LKIADFKRIAPLLKKAYKEVEEKALNQGMDILSPEYQELIDEVRILVLQKHGFTLEEYQAIKEEIEENKRSHLESLFEESRESLLYAFNKNHEQVMEQINGILGQLKNVPTEERVTEIARDVAEKTVKPPQIINQIVKEVTIEKPQIVKETTVVEKLVEKEDNNTLDLDVLNEMEYRLAVIEEDMRTEFGKNLKSNINILGMPDFRKLAMGLQQQIDALGSVTGGTGFNTETPGGAVDGSNLTYTVSNEPKAVIIDGLYRVEGQGYTYAGGTITVNADNPPVFFIRSIY
jgi:hypothetical protein